MGAGASTESKLRAATFAASSRTTDVSLALAPLKSLEVLVLGRTESRRSSAIPLSGACLAGALALSQMT